MKLEVNGRQFLVKFQYDKFQLEYVEEKEIRGGKKKVFYIKNMRRTECRIYEGESLIAEGHTHCLDMNFDKRTGRKIVFGQAVCQLFPRGLTGDQRRQVWEAAWKHRERIKLLATVARKMAILKKMGELKEQSLFTVKPVEFTPYSI